MKMSRVAVVVVLICNGCSYYMPSPPCPPPPSAKFPLTDTFSCDSQTVELCYPEPTQELALCDLVDIALQNSPKTRSSWYKAKEAAAQLGTARGAYIPKVDFQAYWQKEETSEVDLNIESVNAQKTLSLGFSTTYLLFDFGGRNAQLAAAIAALAQSNWQYNWDVQTVMLTTINNYYEYVDALGTLRANEATVHDKKVTLEAATALRAAGVHGLSDQLQAETSLLQSEIALEQARKTTNINYAKLVQSLGLPPDSCITASSLPNKIETKGVCGDMAVLLKVAKDNRADLMAQRSFVQEQKANLLSARSKFLPSMSNTTSGSRVSLNGFSFFDNYNLQFTLDVPLFNAFSDINAIRKAQAQLLAAQAGLDNEELQAYLEVLTHYYEFIANTDVLKYSCTYVETAKKNQEVAFANYRAGITTIIDLMTATEALNSAMIQIVNAKKDFLTALANLAYATGGLSTNEIKLDQTVSAELVETGGTIETNLSCTD